MVVKDEAKSPHESELEFAPISDEARRHDDISRLRALQERILARRGGKPIPEDVLDAALCEAEAAHEEIEEDEIGADGTRTESSSPSDLTFLSISEATRRQALGGASRLRALQEFILARRGGKPFPEEVLTEALREARAAHMRGE